MDCDMAPEYVGDLGPEGEESGSGEVEGGDDPVELSDLAWKVGSASLVQKTGFLYRSSHQNL
jgi:hypothetical protein